MTADGEDSTVRRRDGQRDGRRGRVLTRSALASSMQVDRSGPTITLPVAALVLLGLLVTVSAATLLDPRAHDGGALIGGAFGVPMVVVALTIQLAAGRAMAKRHTGRGFLWWSLLVLPVGSAVGILPAAIREPDYFEGSSLVGVALSGLFLAVIGVLFGPLLWFFIVFPLSAMVQVIVELVQGKRPRWFRVVGPLILLALAAIILFGAGAIDTVASGRQAWGAIIAAILGLPGAYDVEWAAGLWIVRGLVLLVVVPPIVVAIRARRRRAAATTSDAAQDGTTAAEGHAS